MGAKGILFAVASVLISSNIYYKAKSIFESPEKPQIDDIWWGPGSSSRVDTSIRPFKINVSDEVLKDLQDRLDNHIPFEPPLEGVKQHYGINTDLLNTIVEFWRTKYNWREREAFLNQFPQFKVNIQGLDIHYIHVKPKTKGVKVLPLLLLHGWPGSVREFYEIIPMLTTPQKGGNIAFEVIIPSLPGYGFSDGASRPGLHHFHIANIFNNLMNRLGFRKYYVQGGDWGSIIVQLMAAMYPDNIIGMHSNWCSFYSPSQFLKTIVGRYFPSLVGIRKDEAKYMMSKSKDFHIVLLETGYFHIQATKPDTVGVALRDSPAGLAGYILEKFISGTNPAWKDLEDGGLTKKFTYTDLLDNVMIYWITGSMTTAMRLYAEFLNKNTPAGLTSLPIDVPSGCPKFLYEANFQPDAILKERFSNLIHTANYDGGHFAAFEVPETLAQDIFQFVNKVESLKSI